MTDYHDSLLQHTRGACLFLPLLLISDPPPVSQRDDAFRHVHYFSSRHNVRNATPACCLCAHLRIRVDVIVLKGVGVRVGMRACNQISL